MDPLTGPLTAGLRQPDARSCGAASTVMAAALRDAALAERVTAPGGFDAEVLAAHRRLTRLVLHARPQLPWPRVLGTPPWAVARELGALCGVPHRTRVVRWSRTPTGPVAGAVYVGSRWLPRHVMLVLDGQPTRCYNPATGQVRPLDDPRLSSWRTRWFEITPRARRTRA